MARLSGLPRPQPPSVGRPAEVENEELGDPPGGLGPVGPAGGPGRFGQRRAEHGVPLGEDLVVQSRTDALPTGFEEQTASLLDVVRSPQRAIEGTTQDGPAFKVAGPGDAVPVEGHGAEFGPRHLRDLGRGPDVEAALLALRVGVLGAVEAAFGSGQVPQNVRHRLGHHLVPAVVTGGQGRMQVDADQPGLVVEHFLEVGNRPGGFGRVPGEAATQMVVDAAGGHGIERGHRHRQ